MTASLLILSMREGIIKHSAWKLFVKDKFQFSTESSELNIIMFAQTMSFTYRFLRPICNVKSTFLEIFISYTYMMCVHDVKISFRLLYSRY